MSGWIAADSLDKDGLVDRVREPIAAHSSIPATADRGIIRGIPGTWMPVRRICLQSRHE